MISRFLDLSVCTGLLKSLHLVIIDFWCYINCVYARDVGQYTAVVTTLVVGLPAPWPDLVSTRINNGLV